jgi:hypothetical protein
MLISADQSVLSTAPPAPSEAASVTLTGILEGWWMEASEGHGAEALDL